MCTGKLVANIFKIGSLGLSEELGYDSVIDDIEGALERNIDDPLKKSIGIDPPKVPDVPTIGDVTPAPAQIGDSTTKAALTQGTPRGQRRSQKSAARLGTSQFVIPPPQGINLPR